MCLLKRIKRYFKDKDKEYTYRRRAIFRICCSYKEMSLEELARKMGVTVSWVERRLLPPIMLNKDFVCFESDNAERISEKDLKKFLDVFGMDMDEYTYWYRLFNHLYHI